MDTCFSFKDPTEKEIEKRGLSLLRFPWVWTALQEAGFVNREGLTAAGEEASDTFDLMWKEEMEADEAASLAMEQPAARDVTAPGTELS